MAKPCTPHPHCAARAVIQATICQCWGSRGPPHPNRALGGGARAPPPPFSWGSKGAILSRERMAPLSAHPAARREQSAEHRAAKNILPFSKEKRTPLPRRSSYFCESKIYRYFCMPSVARAGSPETEMVNLTPVALLKRSSSFRKSSAAWLHSPPVILNRLSMKMWEIS